MSVRDYLNVSTRAEMYNFVMQSDQAWISLGVSATGDAPSELWYFSATSTATDNGTTVIKPTAIMSGSPGRYLRHIQESDWNSTNNKPTLSSVATSGDYNDLSNKPTIPSAQIQSDWTQTNNALADFVKNKPALKRVDTYLGTSDASGNYTVTYGTAFSTTPDVQPQLQAGTVNQMVRITASSTTGFTVNVTQRAVLTILGLDVLAGTATAVNGASVGVLVTSR